MLHRLAAATVGELDIIHASLSADDTDTTRRTLLRRKPSAHKRGLRITGVTKQRALMRLTLPVNTSPQRARGSSQTCCGAGGNVLRHRIVDNPASGARQKFNHA